MTSVISGEVEKLRQLSEEEVKQAWYVASDPEDVYVHAALAASGDPRRV